jgi:hypothetical protein
MNERRNRSGATSNADKPGADPAGQGELPLPNPLSLPPEAPHHWERLELPSTYKRALNVDISEATLRKLEYLKALLKIPKCKLAEQALEEWATEQLRRLGIRHGQAVSIRF